MFSLRQVVFALASAVVAGCLMRERRATPTTVIDIRPGTTGFSRLQVNGECSGDKEARKKVDGALQGFCPDGHLFVAFSNLADAYRCVDGRFAALITGQCISGL